MTRDDLKQDESFLLFQTRVLHAQMDAEAHTVNSGLLTDRSIFDPIAYAAWRFGVVSPQVHTLVHLLSYCVTSEIEPAMQQGACY